MNFKFWKSFLGTPKVFLKFGMGCVPKVGNEFENQKGPFLLFLQELVKTVVFSMCGHFNTIFHVAKLVFFVKTGKPKK